MSKTFTCIFSSLIDALFTVNSKFELDGLGKTDTSKTEALEIFKNSKNLMLVSEKQVK